MAVKNNILPVNSLPDLRSEKRMVKQQDHLTQKQNFKPVASFEEYLMAVAARNQAQREVQPINFGRSHTVSLQDISLLQQAPRIRAS